MLDNNWHKKETPMFSMGGLGGGAFQQVLARAAAAAGGGVASRSLRFNNDDSAHLTRTPSSGGNQKIWTWSGWVKRSSVSGASTYPDLFGSFFGNSSRYTSLRFDPNDKLFFFGGAGNPATNVINLQTSQVFRDFSAWYHIVLAFDTTQSTASNRAKLYVNGAQITDFDTETYPAQNVDYYINQVSVEHAIGSFFGTGDYLDGCLADVYFIDGSQLEPTSFGEYDNSGVWQAKNYIGTKNQDPTFGLSSSDIVSSTGFQSGEGADKVIDSTDPTANRAHTVAGNAGETLTVTFNPAVTVNTSLEIYAYLTVSGDSEERRARVNGGDWFNPSSTADDYHDLGFTGTLSTIQIQYNGSVNSRSMTMRGIRIDGVFVHTGAGGANSFHLPFSDATSTTTIAEDTSGNSNDFTASGISVTAGSGNDSMFDTPKNDTENTDSGAGGEVTGNYCVFNFLNKGDDITLSNGNLQAATTSSPKDGVFGTIGVSSGKYYWEVELTSADGNTNAAIGVALGSLSPDAATPTSAGAYFYSSYNGNKWLSSADSSYGASYTTGDIIGVALDLDNSTLAFYKNGVSQGNATTSLPSGTYFPYVGDNANNAAQTVVANWGQRPFEYAAPSNHKCLTTTSLPTPTVADGSDYFNTVLYSGNATARSITTGHSSDFVWIKMRNSGNNHFLFDIVRGVGRRLMTSGTNDEDGDSSTDTLTSFNSDGFSLGADTATGGVNANGVNLVAWSWDAGSSTVSNTDGSVTSQVRANQTAGISVVTYTNPSSGSFTVGHGLNADVGMIITKHRNRSSDWYVWHSAYTSEDDYINLNTTAAKGTATDFWGANPPGNSTFGGKIGTSALAGDTDVAIVFSAVEGFSSFGSYTGNGSSDGPFAYTGHKIAWLMIKDSSSTGAWIIWDIARQDYNVQGPYLLADTTDTEQDSDLVDFLSNGFKIRTTAGSMNSSSQTYIWAAFAENPYQANGGIAR